jgi:hypothetical protein
MERTRDLVLTIWLGKKTVPVPLLKCVLPRRRNDVNRRPAVPHGVCQLHSHRPRHSNICKHDANVPAAFKEYNRLISRRSDKDWAYSRKACIYSRDRKVAARIRDRALADNPDSIAAGRRHAS